MVAVVVFRGLELEVVVTTHESKLPLISRTVKVTENQGILRIPNLVLLAAVVGRLHLRATDNEVSNGSEAATVITTFSIGQTLLMGLPKFNLIKT